MWSKGIPHEGDRRAHRKCLISRQKPSTHSICWGNRFLTPGQRPLDAVTVRTHSLCVPYTGTALCTATFLQEGMVAIGLPGHSSVSQMYSPVKPKHTLKELLYSRASTSGRILDFKVYLHIYYNTSRAGFFLKVIATSVWLWWGQFLLLMPLRLLSFWILQKS